VKESAEFFINVYLSPGEENQNISKTRININAFAVFGEGYCSILTKLKFFLAVLELRI
jgi:hypothetical protein